MVENWFRLVYAKDGQIVPDRQESLCVSVVGWATMIIPDLLSLCIAFIMSFENGYSNSTNETFLHYILIPVFGAVIVVLCVMQSKRYRYGVLRYVAQFPVILVLGYASYPIYLLQQVLLNYYAKLIYDVSTWCYH